MTPTPTSGAAIQRYKIGYHADEWGQRSSTPSGIPDASGSWVRYADHVAALAAGQATAAQPAPATQQAGEVPLDEARRLFDAGWKAAALFCDREDVVADGIIGFGACPQFEAAFSAARGIKGGQHGTE